MEENNPSSNYDVIIIGAGPGGLRCAEILSGGGKKVLLLEKNNKIGPKVCAGGLTRKSFQFLGSPSEIIGKEFESIIFKDFKAETKLSFREKFVYTVNREKLGQWQLKRLENSSATVKTGAEVAEITKDSVTLKNGEIFKYQYLVGADGSNSQVRKYLKIPTKMLGVGCQYILPQRNIYPEVEIFFNSNLFGPWYSWIFPHADFVSTGYGYFPMLMSGEKAKKKYEDWARKMGVDLSEGRFEAHPINCDYRGFRFGNVFLIGDAAGLASGFTGEGIYPALASGDDVARKILDPKHRTKLIRRAIIERNIHHIMLVAVFLAGPLRDFVFRAIIIATRNKWVARFLLRILT